MKPCFFPVYSKLTGERFGVGFDFTDQLPTGATIASGTGAAYDLSNARENVSATFLVSTTATVSGNIVTVRLTGGTAGHTYLIVISAVLSSGSPADTLQESLVMQVLDV